MYAYLKGKIAQINPTDVILDVHDVGYQLSISLNTYEKIAQLKEVKLLTHFWVKEDGHSLFGFFAEDERQIFKLLITVSGIGPNTARTFLSTLTPSEVVSAISSGNVPLLKSVKGIGIKTAQRMVLELQDKVNKGLTGEAQSSLVEGHLQKEEALAALVMLGFARNAAEKALAQVVKKHQGQDLSVEELIKHSLKAI